MKQRYLIICGLLVLLLPRLTYSQKSIAIPAYTAYATPTEATNDNGESNLFSEKYGLQNWTDTKQQIQFYFNVRKTGTIGLTLLIKNNTAGNSITAVIAGKIFVVQIPQSKIFKQVTIGTVAIKTTGFYTLTLSSIQKKGKTIAEIKSLQLSGIAVKDIHFNTKPRRNAASVHLIYPLDDSIKATSFYSEITVAKDADLLHSYYMACGFARGYFGIQVNSLTERRVIFSVWDAGNEAIDRNKVSADNKVQLMAKGEDVFADDFGNEGTGGHSHWIYNWKAGETYKFLVTAAVDSAANTTNYAGYFLIPEKQQWKLIACFKAPKDGKPLRKLYSFVENFDGNNGQLLRKANFGKQWVRRDNGDWYELTQSTFSYDATGKAGDRIDYGGGTADTSFYLWNGGFTNIDTKFGDLYNRKPTTGKPIIDFYKNVDSLIIANKQQQEIISAIQKGSIDTTGRLQGLFYKIIKEGNGATVSINDTLIVNYKGQLLNGFVFDENKDKPVTFPLKRLIKGWQIGLPLCKQGGKIRLIIPSSLAYSIRNSAKIPPNSVLIFDIEVLEIKKS